MKFLTCPATVAGTALAFLSGHRYENPFRSISKLLLLDLLSRSSIGKRNA